MAKQKQKAGAEKRKSRLWLPIGILAAVAIALAGCWLAAKQAVRARNGVVAAVAGFHENQLSIEKLEITPAPDWVREDLAADAIAHLQSSNQSLSLIDPDLVGNLTEAFQQSPWTKDVRVEKRYGNVRVELSYRQPVLSVPYGRYNCYVDADGVALPPPMPANTPEQFKQCLWIERLETATIPQVGMPFTNPRLLQAAKLAQLLVPRKAEFGIVAIVVVSAEDQPLACNLRTRMGSRIILGTIPDDIEDVWLEERMTALRQWLERYGSLDAPQGPYQFELRGGQLIEPVPLVALTR